MERNRGVSREQFKHPGAVEHAERVASRDPAVIPVSRAQQESANISAG